LIGGVIFLIGDRIFLIGGIIFLIGDIIVLIGGIIFLIGDIIFLIGGIIRNRSTVGMRSVRKYQYSRNAFSKKIAVQVGMCLVRK
jgi:hypothetical protein